MATDDLSEGQGHVKPPRRLIEDWLPVAAVGVESERERAPLSPFPAPNRLHVWWARRPLVTARTAVLASMLPADADRARVLRVLGIHGDAVATKRELVEARQSGARTRTNPYGYRRAFSYTPDAADVAWLRSQMEKLGISDPVVCDPTAGGGAIPLEAHRLGLGSHANDLNPVASAILRATLEAPLEYGESIVRETERLFARFREACKAELDSLYPPEPLPDASVFAYLWARTIRCPRCGGTIPLASDWRLGTNAHVRVRAARDTGICSFEVVTSGTKRSAPTIHGGVARCLFPRCGHTIRGPSIKRQAVSGEMGEQLYAIAYRVRVSDRGTERNGRVRRARWEVRFRSPRTEDDVRANIAQELASRHARWQRDDVVPTESIAVGTKTRELLRYGMNRWTDLFAPRQLLSHGVSVECFRRLFAEDEAAACVSETTRASYAYLAFALDKARDYNSRLTRWHRSRGVVVSTFDRHAFGFQWSYAEMAMSGAGDGLAWCLDETEKAVRELVELVHGIPRGAKTAERDEAERGGCAPRVTCESADDLVTVADASVDAVVMDPPYFDNVMYAELSDFFYVWLRRTAGAVTPEFFAAPTTDKEREAIANIARFSGTSGSQRLAAARDYHSKMRRIFVECRRVLRPDGMLTLLFMHQDVAAWTALASALLDAGFTVTASWPMQTEAVGAIGLRGKNAPRGALTLACRPRIDDVPTASMSPLAEQVVKRVRERWAEFEAAGLADLDRRLACLGPALEVLTESWHRRAEGGVGHERGEILARVAIETALGEAALAEAACTRPVDYSPKNLAPSPQAR